MTTTATREVMIGPITSGQRRALFAFGRAHGLTIDDLRAFSPAGSISAMTRAEASRLLDRLNTATEHEHPRRSPRAPRRPAGVYRIATEAQHRKIEALRLDLGWIEEGLREWLSERHHDDGRPMTSIDSTVDGQAVIELLKAVLARTRNQGGGQGHSPRDTQKGRVLQAHRSPTGEGCRP